MWNTESKLNIRRQEEIKKELITDINNVILELNVAQENYNSATKELVDYYLYKIKAIESQYDYLLKIAKKMNIDGMPNIIL